jgi:hypothetical protein
MGTYGFLIDKLPIIISNIIIGIFFSIIGGMKYTYITHLPLPLPIVDVDVETK